MNAPHHAVELKRQDWAEKTTCRAFMLNAGKPDGDDVALMLDVLYDHWERIAADLPDHAFDAAEEALSAINLAFSAVDAALVEAESDPVSDREDFAQIDNKARMENVGGEL